MSDLTLRLRSYGDFKRTTENNYSAAELLEGAAARIEQLEAALPEGMKHCTIQFKQCEKGHGTLTATNWVQHGCQQCEIDRLRSALTDIANCELPQGMDADLFARATIQQQASTEKPNG